MNLPIVDADRVKNLLIDSSFILRLPALPPRPNVGGAEGFFKPGVRMDDLFTTKVPRMHATPDISICDEGRLQHVSATIGTRYVFTAARCAHRQNNAVLVRFAGAAGEP